MGAGVGASVAVAVPVGAGVSVGAGVGASVAVAVPVGAGVSVGAGVDTGPSHLVNSINMAAMAMSIAPTIRLILGLDISTLPVAK